MNVTIYHDDRGNITALVARSDEAPPAHMASQFPSRITEVQESSLTADLDPAEICKRLAQLKEGRRVEVDAGTGRLIER